MKQVYVADGAGSGTWVKFSESAELTLAAADVTFAHGLGAVPSKVQALLRCKIADRGYSIGDEILVTCDAEPSGGRGITIFANSTVVGSAMSSNGILIIDRSAFNPGIMTTANWKIVFRAWSY